MESKKRQKALAEEVVKESQILFVVWLFATGAGLTLLAIQAIESIQSWIGPLLKVPPRELTSTLPIALENISRLLHQLKTYGIAFLIFAMLLIGSLYWAALRSILVEKLGSRNGNKTGE